MVLQLLTHFSYVAIFGLLVGAGLGLPFPEEVTQLSAGFLSHQGIIAFVPALVTTYTGILAGDYLLFRLGRRHGPSVLHWRPIAALLTPARRAWIARHFARHDFLTIMVARHASGLRLPTFAMAGAMGVKSSTFLLADGLSALVSVPLVVTLGYVFADNLEKLRKDIRHVQLIGLGVLLLLVGISVLLRLLRRRRAAAPREVNDPKQG